MNIDISESVSIPFSKGKIILLVSGAIIFVIACIWLWTLSEIQNRYSPVVVKVVSGTGIIFFGLCCVVGIRKVFDSRPGLIISSDGIFDNSSGVSAGTIPWNDITGIDITTVKRQMFLTIKVKDPEIYIARGNLFKRIMIASNMKLFGSPVQISSNALQTDFHTLTEIVSRYYEYYKEKC